MEPGARLRRATVLVISAAVLVVGAGMARPAQHAAAAGGTCPTFDPKTMYPNDPSYAPAEQAGTTSTWNDEQWYLYSCIPRTAPTSADPEDAAGLSVDQVWSKYTKGRDDVLVGYMEGGVNWRLSASCDLKDQAWLNSGELPYPEDTQGKTKADLGLPGDPYDLNGDGVVNVEDYLNDPRVTRVTAALHHSPDGGRFLHHVCDTTKTGIPVAKGGTDITPEDLIAAFGNCLISAGRTVGAFPCDPTRHYDNDGNGYANDISGWNFNRDTNDPQTEQSTYGHFTGESAQLVGQGDNNFYWVGVCPKCRYVPIEVGDEALDRPDRIAEGIVYAADLGVKAMDATVAGLGLTNEVKAAIDYAYHKGMVLAMSTNDLESADHIDGMFYPHVWPGNAIVGDHTSHTNLNCTSLPGSPVSCPVWYETNNTFRSRSSESSYGPHALFAVPNPDGSSSTDTPTQAGIAALVMSEGLNARDAGHISSPLDAEEVRQVVRSTASYIGTLPACPTCFQGLASGTSFNIQYGYGRPNALRAVQAVDQGLIPPTVDIRSPDWYEEVDPTKVSRVHVSADVAARRAPGGAYTYEMQYGLGPQPLDAEFHTFASGSASGVQTVSGDLDLSQIPPSFWSGQYSVDPVSRLSIERYDVTIRVRVFASGDHATAWRMGEDRRAFHLRHDDTESPGFPIRIGSSGESSPAMADIEGRGWLDTIVGTADGTLHAIRPDGNEAPGFPVRTGPAPGVDPTYDTNYLSAPAWRSGLPRPRDGTASPVAVGDLRHDGALEVVMSTLSGRTYVWDGAGRLLPGFPVLDGDPRLSHFYDPAKYSRPVPTPDTPYNYEPENFTIAAPVLADLRGDGHLEIIQAAGDNHIYAWEATGSGVQQSPGWPVCDVFTAAGAPLINGPCEEPPSTGSIVRTHNKLTATPAIADINGDGTPDVIVGTQDTTWDTSSPLGSNKVTGYVEAFSGKGTAAGNGGVLPGWPVAIPGLIQAYGGSLDFVATGVGSPATYDIPGAGPQAIVNANIFLPCRIDLRSHQVVGPFVAATVPAESQNLGPGGPMVQLSTSPGLGKVRAGPLPQVFQAGTAVANAALSVTQTPGLGIREQSGLGGWDPLSGALLPAFTGSYVQGLPFLTGTAVADVTGDGTPDVIQPSDSGALQAFDGLTGQSAVGFPKWTGGWSFWTPAVGDARGDGTVSVAVTTREGSLHLWQTPGRTSANAESWHWHQDDRNTGHYGTDTRPPAAVRDLKTTTGVTTDTLSFTSPGNDWNSGTPARYEVRSSNRPITQDSWAQSTPVAVSTATAAGGTRVTVTVPHVAGASYYAVRAVDVAGNIGPVVVNLAAPAVQPPPASTSGAPGGPLPSTLPPTPVTANVLVAGLLVGVATGARIRRRRRYKRGSAL